MQLDGSFHEWLEGRAPIVLINRTDNSGRAPAVISDDVRGIDESNRSIVTLELTERGRKVVKQVTARRRRELARILDRLDPDVRSACADGLRTLHEHLGDDRPGLHGPMSL